MLKLNPQVAHDLEQELFSEFRRDDAEVTCIEHFGTQQAFERFHNRMAELLGEHFLEKPLGHASRRALQYRNMLLRCIDKGAQQPFDPRVVQEPNLNVTSFQPSPGQIAVFSANGDLANEGHEVSEIIAA